MTGHQATNLRIEQARRAELLEQAERLDRDSRRMLYLAKLLLIVALGFLFGVVATKASAEEPYFEAWAVRGQAYTRNYPAVTDRLFEARSYWGAELIGRYPMRGIFGRAALFARLSSEGAAGSHSYRDPGTWTRAVGEIGASYQVVSFADRLFKTVTPEEMRPRRYTCSVFGGYGISRQLERGRLMPQLDADENELGGPPPRFGGGIHCRDEKLRMWGQVRAEWDATVGPGVHPAASLHLPLFGERGALGVEVVWGDFAKVQVKVKALLFRR